MKTIILPRSRLVTAVRAAFVANLALLAHTCLHAETPRQRISFETTYTELGAAQNRVEVRLVRCEGIGNTQEALPVVLKVRALAGAGVWSVSDAYFGAGSSAAVCTVRLNEGAEAGLESVGLFEIEETKDVQPFARTGHCIRKRALGAINNGPVINAVVFSGAETPENAVEAGPGGALVVGGIVALGGTPMAPALFSASFRPRFEYAAGVWIPPLWPAAALVQFGPWKSNIAQ